MGENNGGRVVLLTGAAGGLGTVMTTALLEAGHAVAAVDRDLAALEKLSAAPSIAQHRDRFVALPAELARVSECAEAVAGAVAHFGRLEGVINNAGIGPSSLRPDAENRRPTIEELNADIWDRFFAINVRAAMLVTKAALPHMKARRWGRVINNTTSYRTMLRVLPYGASKSALESMAAVWADELKGSGITVNVLVPGGPTDTPFIADGSGWHREQMLRPQIMAAPIRWLMSDASNDVSGQRFTGADWNASLPDAQAAATASRGIGWPELAAQTAWWPSGG